MSMEWHSKVARRVLNGALAAALTTAMSPAAAYEVQTHSRLTLAAFDKSVLADATSGPLLALGVDDLTRKFRTVPPTGGGEMVPVAEVVGLAAQYEDQNLLDGRFVRHFFDPQQGGTGLGSYPSSREWILESEGDIAEQQYSLRDAHQFYLNALTRLDKTSREQNLVLLLQSIGRAVHHLQDMSQPAHTRDDIHPHGADGDFYEIYTNTQFYLNNRPLPDALPCGEPTIDLHQFNTAAKFWSDDDEGASGGRGIAQFTSQNFVSQDTNFRHALSGGSAIPDPEHPKPAFPASPVVTSVPISQLDLFGLLASPMEFIGLPIADKVSGGGCFNNRAVVRSFMHLIFSQFPAYSLNSLTWEANYPILFPRAIAYSTGLMNYYFRGKLQLESYSVAGATVQVVVRNVSAADFALAEAPGVSGAEFSVYYDAEDGERHRLALQGDDLGGESLAFNETSTFSFALPADVSKTQERPFVLVFDGNIGAERGIAAVAIGPQDRALVVTPNYVPTDQIAGARLLTQSQGAWQATQQINPVAGNIDWRGHRPEDVLTWHGPQGRYFGKPVSSSPNIYQGGKRLTVAPGNVIGAAITSQGDLKYLLAAVLGQSVTIYRRPFQLSYSNDGLYDPLNNPLGWKAIQTFNASATSPMFFNASGTEAQMFASWMHRIKVSVSGETATMARIETAGSYRHLSQSSSTPYVSVEVDPGPERSCGAYGNNCTGGSGTCTSSRDGSTHLHSCMVERSDENVTHGSNSSGVSTQENIRSTVVCADYIGDIEVLCTIEATPDLGASAHSYEIQRHYTEIYTVDPGTCDITGSGAHSFHSHEESDSESAVTMQFRVGSHTIPFEGSSLNDQANYNVNLNWSWPSEMPPLTVDYTTSHAVRRYDSHVIYADARYDILVYEEFSEDTVTTGNGSAVAHYDSGDGDYYMVADVIRTKSRTSKTIVLADQQYVLATHVDESPPESTWSMEDPYFREPSGTPCSNGNPTNGQDEYTVNYYADDFFSYSIHPKIKEYDVQQSFSTLSQGSFVASLPIWIRQSDDSYVRQGTWSHLSNGDLSTLLPATEMPQEPTYTPTGIAR